MEIEATITIDDVQALMLHHARTSPVMRRKRLIWGVIVPVCWCLAWLAAVMSTGAFWTSARALLPLLIGAPFLAWVIWRSPVRGAKAVATQHDYAKESGMLGKRRVSLTPQGITESGEFGESTTRWSALNKIDTTDTHAFFYNSELTAIVVPVRAFKSAEEFERFVQAARELHEQN